MKRFVLAVILCGILYLPSSVLDPNKPGVFVRVADEAAGLQSATFRGDRVSE